MRWSPLLLLAPLASAASWSFSDATVSISHKASKDQATAKFTDTKPAAEVLTLDHTGTLKVGLTAKDGGKGKKPHQAFLMLRESVTGLEAPFGLGVKNGGEGHVEITQKDLPVQFLKSEAPLEASIVIGSFGSSTPIATQAFKLHVKLDPQAPQITYEAPLRYGKQPEIHHIFRDDPKSPPMVISIAFVLAVVATVPALFVAWLLLGANANHLSKAMGKAPLAHATFFGSIVAMEGVFFMYYSAWNLFQTLPIAGVVGVVAFLSGTRALGEVQVRRMAGER